jgi:hypothetical protein
MTRFLAGVPLPMLPSPTRMHLAMFPELDITNTPGQNAAEMGKHNRHGLPRLDLKEDGKLCVLLGSHGTSGVDLNLECASVLNQCGPWWKASWEEQAICRICRHGQTRPTFHYQLEAIGSLVDEYKKERRSGKNDTNTRIMDEITWTVQQSGCR